MKKIFSIFLLILTLLPLQASVYQTSVITIRSTVNRITLSDASVSEDGTLGLYKLYGGLESADSAKVDYILADDISRSDVTVYFRIAQLAKTRTDESIRISVEAECLVNTDSQFILSQDPSKLVTTGEPVISNITCLGRDALDVTSFKDGNNSVLFTLNYYIGKPVENVNVAFFTSTWKKTEGLEPGLYTAKIILSYILN